MLRLLILSLGCCLLCACQQQAKFVAQWEFASSGLYDAAISHNGRYAVVSSFIHGVSYWDRKQQKQLYRWHHGNSDADAIAHIAFASDDSHVITADQRAFVVWNCKTGESLGYWSVDADIMDVALSNQGRYILLGLKDGRAFHIDRLTQRRLEIIAHHKERVTSVDLSKDGTIAVTGGNDQRVVIWRSKDASVVQSYDAEARVKLVKLNPTNKQVFINTEDNKALIYDVKSGNKVSNLLFKPRQGLVSSARFTRNGKQLLLGFPGRELSLWDTTNGALLNRWSAPNRKVGWSPQSATIFSVAFTKDQKNILAQASNGLGAEWPIKTY